MDRADGTAGADQNDGLTPGFTTRPHALIIPDELNPRRDFDPVDIAQLADSIAGSDFWVSPLLIRPLAPKAGHPQPVHRLVAGERRHRAVALLIEQGRWPQGKGVPVEIRDMDDRTHLRLALVENVQRSGLKPLEEARGYKQLQDDFGLSAGDIAKDVGFTPRFVQQRLALLELSPSDQARLDAGELTIEQARNLVANRPPPIALGPVQLMVLAECADHIFGPKKPQAHVTGQIDHTVGADALYEALAPAGVVQVYSNWDSKLWVVCLTANGVRALEENAPDFAADRAACLARLRALGASAKAVAAAAGGEGYVTPWLNPPYTASPADLEAMAAKADAARRNEAAREERRFRELEEQARDRLALHGVRTLEREANELPALEFASRYRAAWTSMGHAFPWRVDCPEAINSWEHPEPELVDANGKRLGAFDAGLEARRRLIAMAINLTNGLPPYAGEPITDEALAAILAPPQDGDEEEPEEDDVEVEAESEGEGEDRLTGDSFSDQIRRVVADAQTETAQ